MTSQPTVCNHRTVIPRSLPGRPRPIGNRLGVRRLATALVFGFLTISCGTPSGSGPGDLSIPDHVKGMVTQEYLDDLQRRVAAIGGVQAEILADGEVTSAELERAAFAVRACMEDRGVNVVDFTYERGQMSVTIEHTDGQIARDTMIQTECETENFDLVSEVVALQRMPTEQERSRQVELLLACLEAAGVRDQFDDALGFVGENPSAVTVLVECAHEMNSSLPLRDEG